MLDGGDEEHDEGVKVRQDHSDFIIRIKSLLLFLLHIPF